VIFALGRPLLSATNAVATVIAAESTGTGDRAKAVALVVAGYGVGTGLTAVVHGWFGNAVGFRGLLLLAALPLVAILLIRRLLIETDRFTVGGFGDHAMPVLGAIERRYRKRLLVVALLAFSVSIVTGPANSFIFVYAENVLHITDAATASMVVVASIFGLGGLLFGRWLADRVGRRPAGAGAMIAMALCAVLTYSGSRTALFVGYELAVFSASTFAPGAGAMVNELFPTSVRASVSGWYVAAGVLGAVVGLIAFAEVGAHGDSLRASMVTFLPVVVASALFVLLPETVGREPEDLWPQEK
jgi:MFS family permease